MIYGQDMEVSTYPKILMHKAYVGIVLQDAQRTQEGFPWRKIVNQARRKKQPAA